MNPRFMNQRRFTGNQRSVHLLWALAFCACLLIGLLACSSPSSHVRENLPLRGDTFRVAVFPLENLTGTSGPLNDIRNLLIDHLRRQDIALLEDQVLGKFMDRHRIRYAAGLDKRTAKALKEETGADGVLIASLELYSEKIPPKVALFARLVSTGDPPVILWMDGIGKAGNDSPGILELGLIEDPPVLLNRALEYLTGSLRSHLSGLPEAGGKKAQGKFRPKVVFRSDLLDPNKKYSVAVLPFFNKSDRKYAGEILSLHLITSLKAFENLDFVEPGVVRQELLRFRVIMTEGVSLANTETVLGALDADLVLNGEVLSYQDSQGATGSPKVDFSLLFIERQSRKVVYSSYSFNKGDDGVFLFDWGSVYTAHAMASQMARWVGEQMMKEGKRGRQ
jgi:hypothetical protein